jgi:hypothetical protein
MILLVQLVYGADIGYQYCQGTGEEWEGRDRVMEIRRLVYLKVRLLIFMPVLSTYLSSSTIDSASLFFTAPQATTRSVLRPYALHVSL